MAFPSSASLASLCLAAITHSFLLFHCFPYLGYMSLIVKHPFHDVTVDSVGWYAGLLGTAFTTGRCLGFVPWKKLRHWQVCGEKNSLLLSLFLSAVCSVWFGMSTTFSSAVLARFCLGLSNTLSGCLKRIAIHTQKAVAAKRSSSTVIQTNISHEEELAPSRILAVMWWGSVLGPCVGGMLSNDGALSRDTWMPNAIEIPYPFLLPNAVGAILCLLSMAGVAAFVPDQNENAASFNNTTTRVSASCAEKRPLLVQTNNDDSKTSSDQKIILNVWESANTRLHLIAYWTFSFVVVCVDEALPLFLISQLSGPGLLPKQIGWILSTAGLMVVSSQSLSLERSIISSSDNSSLGLYPSLKVAAVMGNVPSVLVPVMLALNGGTYYYLKTKGKQDNEGSELFSSSGTTAEAVLGSPPGDLNWSSFLFLALLIGCLRIFCSIYFAIIGVATGRTVPPFHRDHVARIMTLGALCARAVAPAIAGMLVSTFLTASMGSNNGADAIALWSVIGLAFGLGAAAWTFLLKCPSDGNNTQSPRSKRQSMYLDNRQRSHVFVKLWEVHYDRGSTTVGSKWRRLARKVIAFNRMATPKTSRHESLEEAAVEQEKRYEIPKRKSWIDHILQPGVDVDTVDFVILGTNKNDKSCMPHVLTPPLMEALHQHLPMSCREYNFWLKYSLVRDGASIAALEPKIMFSKNTIVAIETLEGEVFGCFMNNPWKNTNTYEMSGESFLWRMREQRSASIGDSVLEDEEALDEVARKEGDVEIFWWTGENDECQLLSDDRIAAGSGIISDSVGRDGFGFIIEDGLSKGTSSPCLTYDNPCLVSSNDGRFEVSNIEVWAMTPYLSTTLAEQSEDMVRFIQENTTNARGDAPSSAQSAWTNFL